MLLFKGEALGVVATEERRAVLNELIQSTVNSLKGPEMGPGTSAASAGSSTKGQKVAGSGEPVDRLTRAEKIEIKRRSIMENVCSVYYISSSSSYCSSNFVE